MARVVSEYLKICSESLASPHADGGDTDALYWHSQYSSYRATKCGYVFNRNGKQIVIPEKTKQVPLHQGGTRVYILQRRFVWECFNGEIPEGHDVEVDIHKLTSYYNKLTLIKTCEKTAFEKCQRNFIRLRLVSKGFKSHPQCPNYIVDSYGTVFSLFTFKPLGTAQKQDGYMMLKIFKDCGSKIMKNKHVIVWEAFASKLVSDGCQIDHTDQNKKNNTPQI